MCVHARVCACGYEKNLAQALEQIDSRNVKMEDKALSENRSSENAYTLKQMENKMNFKVWQLIDCDFQIRGEEVRFE